MAIPVELNVASRSVSSQEDEEKEACESKVTIQHTDSDEEGTKTINDENPAEDATIKSTLNPDSDLHQFSFDGR